MFHTQCLISEIYFFPLEISLGGSGSLGGGWVFSYISYLAIIPRARVGSESIAHEAEG